MKKRLIIWIDSGDTIMDEGTQMYDSRGIVTSAQVIPGADVMLRTLHEQGYPIVLVADGELESFQNVYQKNGLGDCFDEWVISEVVGVQKPEALMFQTALEKLHLTWEDKHRIVMVGNNLKKDIAGANRFQITSIWLDWSPRYFHEIEEEDWKPDYVIKTPSELPALIEHLNQSLEEHVEGSK